MNKLMTVSILAVAFIGCGFTSCRTINVPANEVHFKTPSGELTLKHPQNTKMKDVDVTIDPSGTVHASIGTLETVNSPAVIDRVAAGEVAKINALGSQIREGVKAGLEAAGSAAK